MLFRKQASKDSTESDNTDYRSRIDILSDRLLVSIFTSNSPSAIKFYINNEHRPI